MTTQIMKAIEDYKEKKAHALELVKKVEAGIKADNFDNNWGWANNGTMEHYIAQLQEIVDQLYETGEYAPEPSYKVINGQGRTVKVTVPR